MDAATKIFIFLLIISLLFGTVVILSHPDYRVKNIYQTNSRYYPQINDESISKDFKKIFERVK
jgi:hypothetical protein